MPSHYLNQCWIIVNWTRANVFQWNFNQNTTIFIEECAYENVVCKISAILSQPQCVKHHKRNSLWPSDATWQHGSRSTLAPVMACCLTAPSHYRNQCCLITWEQFHKKCSWPFFLIWNMCSKITLLKKHVLPHFLGTCISLIRNMHSQMTLVRLLPHLPAANSLTLHGLGRQCSRNETSLKKQCRLHHFKLSYWIYYKSHKD